MNEQERALVQRDRRLIHLQIWLLVTETLVSLLLAGICVYYHRPILGMLVFVAFWLGVLSAYGQRMKGRH